MRKVKILVDSCNDLTKEQLIAMNMDIVPLYIIFGEDSYKDGEEISTAQLFDKVEETGQLPKTSAVTPYDFQQTFEKYIEEDYDILCITIGSGFSSTYQNATLAASTVAPERIKVIDTENLSTGIGILALEAYECIQKGMSLEDTVSYVEELRSKVRLSFIVDTLDFLHKGGRCSATQAIFGTMLKIRPIVQVVEGAMTIGAKIRGKKSKGFQYMINELKQQPVKNNRVMLSYSQEGEEEANAFMEMVKQELPDVQVTVNLVGGLISCHCGKKTVGMVYIV